MQQPQTEDHALMELYSGSWTLNLTLPLPRTKPRSIVDFPFVVIIITTLTGILSGDQDIRHNASSQY